MATTNLAFESPETTVKYESPYRSDPPPHQPLHLATKRRQSDSATDVLENDEKRQRIESTGNIAPSVEEDDDFARILAAASSSAEQHLSAPINQPQHNQHFVGNPLPQPTFYPSQPPPYSPNPQFPPEGRYSSDPHVYTRVMSLPMLESLSIQILEAFTQSSNEEAMNIYTRPELELGQAFQTQKSLFDQTRKIYSRDEPFLSADELQIKEPENRSKIRITNLATFVSSVFGSQEVGFYELNDAFLDVFASEGDPLSKEAAILYLSLKTQMFLTAVAQEEEEKTTEEHLDELFPSNYDQNLINRHPTAPLSDSEVEFLQQMNYRREYLKREAVTVEAISSLTARFPWEEFLRNLRSHLKTTYEPIIGPYMSRNALTLPAPKTYQSSVNGSKGSESEVGDTSLDFLDLATQLAQHAALQTVSQPFVSQNGQPYQSPFSNQQHSGQQNSSNGFAQQSFQPGQQPQGGPVPYPTQTAPTQVLYEQARQAAVAKSSPHSRRPGLPSQRRPWSTEEENALMSGLDTVKGPHWSQILALYGPKGSISEILKDRNQVQLKDKARNLKLFFLKSNIEVPYYLQSVTGELKTRAPTQAARREAEERGRLSTDGNDGNLIFGSGQPTQGNQSPSSQPGDPSMPGTPLSQGYSLHAQHSNDGMPNMTSDDGPELFHATDPTTQPQGHEQGQENGLTEELDFDKLLSDSLNQYNALEAASAAPAPSAPMTAAP